MSTSMQKLRELIKIAQSQRAKAAFVDPAAMGGMPPGGAPPMDPSMMGGAPPTDPAMMGGAPPGGGMPMDPAMMGGAPPPAGVTADEVRAIVQEAVGGIGGAGGAPGALKPKIDVNVEIMQIKNILAKIVDAMGIPVPAQDMVATPEKLTAMAQGQNAAGANSAIGAIEPMQGASPAMAQGKSAALDTGQPYREPGPNALAGKAAALAEIRRRRNA